MTRGVSIPKGLNKLGEMLWLQIAAARLPLPALEHPFAKSIGRKWRFDMAYPAPELLVAVEIEGLTVGRGGQTFGRHTSVSGFKEDCHKYNVAALMGWTVLRGDRDLIKRGYLLQYLADTLEGRMRPTLRKKAGTKSVYYWMDR